jgi:hypothetical protein
MKKQPVKELCMKKPLLPKGKKPPKKMALKQELDELIQKVKEKKN